MARGGWSAVGLLLFAVLLWSQSVGAQESEPAVAAESSSSFSEDQLRFFENEIRPLLVAHCLECHSAAKQEGGLRLDSRAALLAGGDSGPAVEVGDSSASRLVAAVDYIDLEMPPDEMLDEAARQRLKDWVDDGLAWPSDSVLQRDLTSREPSAEDREHWAYQPLVAPSLPMLSDAEWASDDLDLFVLRAQRHHGLEPAPQADRATLARRVAFDLTGLPPTPDMLAAFLADTEPGAYERFVDQLLDSPNFGERWAEAWFDWVRFAESDGYKADDFRPSAWRYRDYVIRSLNDDRPFDRFLTEQLAGDLLPDATADSLAATGYLRLWIYEYNQRDAETQWQYILDDVTETTADALLGMGLGCAKCHDHKYDPLIQEDYFRLQATFASFSASDQVPLLGADERIAYSRAVTQWRAKYQTLLDEKAALESEARDQAMRSAVEKFPPNIRGMFALEPNERTSLEQQLVELATRQITLETSKLDFEKKLTGDALTRWQTLRDELKAAEQELPPAPSHTLGVEEIPSAIVSWPVLGDTERTVAPGLPLVLVPPGGNPEFPLEQPRRLEFARWLVSRENPLTARVLANRVWERLMGTGLVASSADFGRLTPPPAQPELLDFLAARWRDDGWSFKQLVRSIVTSSTYRQASQRVDEAACLERDPHNSSWWRTQRRRLEAGQIRDALLAVSGELEGRVGGPSANHDALCRSIYVKVLRNSPEPVMSVFDYPDRIRSQSCRNLTTTPQQALLLLNHPWVRARSEAFAKSVSPVERGWDEATAIEAAFSRAIGRQPTSEERNLVKQFIETGVARGEREGLDAQQATAAAWFDLCHGLLNSNEFLFLE
ncbi:MAG: PSD1 domain-containing protein [Planctomycetales bacterium]|nr:PSD1 domain-containing protein [Planctomycetales bacterium]